MIAALQADFAAKDAEEAYNLSQLYGVKFDLTPAATPAKIIISRLVQFICVSSDEHAGLTSSADEVSALQTLQAADQLSNYKELPKPP